MSFCKSFVILRCLKLDISARGQLNLLSSEIAIKSENVLKMSRTCKAAVACLKNDGFGKQFLFVALKFDNSKYFLGLHS
jgi:hypothetical protein